MNSELYNYLESCWRRDNHPKYQHYFKIWVENITPNQISNFEIYRIKSLRNSPK